MAHGRSGSTKVRVAPQHATFELGTRPAALRNPRLGANSGISIKPQSGVTQYGKSLNQGFGVPDVAGVGFGNTAKSGES